MTRTRSVADAFAVAAVAALFVAACVPRTGVVVLLPGDGAVDFRALLAVLRRSGYRGWLVVEAEQDPVVAPAYRYAEMGYRHLARLVRNGNGAQR